MTTGCPTSYRLSCAIFISLPGRGWMEWACLIFAFLIVPKSVHTRKLGKPTAISQNTACSRKRLTDMPLDRRRHFCAKIKMIFWRKKAASAPQRRLTCIANMPCLTHKYTLIVMQRSLRRNASKASLATNPHFLRHKTPASLLSQSGGTPGKELPDVKKFYCTYYICLY